MKECVLRIETEALITANHDQALNTRYHQTQISEINPLTHIPYHPAQHGSRQKHSTCTTLSTITADIATGFSRKKPAHRTALFALDLTAAFYHVEHQQLLDCVFNTDIHSTICRWLNNYMQNRRAKVHFGKKNKKAEW